MARWLSRSRAELRSSMGQSEKRDWYALALIELEEAAERMKALER